MKISPPGRDDRIWSELQSRAASLALAENCVGLPLEA